MSIASRITSIEEHIGNAYDSIKKFGVDTSVINRNIENIANVINDDIYNKLPKVTVTGQGLTISDVQNGLLDDFKMIGVDLEQDTTTGKNLFKASSSNYPQGLNITYDSDKGTITFSGTTTGTYPTLSNFTEANIPAGTYTFSIDKALPYNLSCRFRNSSGEYPSTVIISAGELSKSITLSYDTVRLELVYSVTNVGVTIPTTTIKPMVELGSTATNWEKYSGGNTAPNPDYPQQIKVVEGRQTITDNGKNLLKPHAMEGTNNGITVSYDEETRVYTFNGTCTQDNTTFILSDKSINFIAGVTKSITYWVDGSCSGYCYIRHYDSSYSVYCNYSIVDIGANNDKIEQLSDKTFLNTSAQCSIRFNSGSVANNLQIKVMVTDDDNTDYEPYYEPIDYNIDLTNDLLKYNKCYFIAESNGWYFLDGNSRAYGSDIGTKTNIKFPVEINKKYTLRYNISIAPNSFQLCYDNENIVATLGKSIGNNSFTFTSDRNGYVIPRVQVNASSQVKITDINVVEGEEDYYDYELAKIPNTDYKNRIYRNNGNWYFEKNIEKIILDGYVNSFASKKGNPGNVYNINQLSNLKSTSSNNEVVNAISNYFTADAYSNLGNLDNGIVEYHDSHEIRFKFGVNSSITTLNLANEWLQNNNVLLYYALVTPVTTQITNTTLINQLEAISVHTGTNIITISNDNNIIPEIEITRLKELERLT